jgi:fatty-acyl-CoA synthase
MDEDLYRGPHSGQMLLKSLRQHRDKPVLQLGDRTITGQEMADHMSRYVRALEDLGAGSGVAVGLLAANRPEVLFLIGAGQTQGYRRTALHPLGSLDDHAYVLEDAGAGALIVDNIPAFLDRAEALRERVPSLDTVITIDDLAAKAATYDAEPLVAKDLAPDHIVGLTYTGGTTGKPKGVIGTASSIAAMTQIQLAEWEWPEAPAFLMCTPLSHAGAAFFAPIVAKGGRLVVLPRFDPEEVLRTIEEERITATMLVPSMLYALMDHPDSRTRDLSSL